MPHNAIMLYRIMRNNETFGQTEVIDGFDYNTLSRPNIELILMISVLNFIKELFLWYL